MSQHKEKVCQNSFYWLRHVFRNDCALNDLDLYITDDYADKAKFIEDFDRANYQQANDFLWFAANRRDASAVSNFTG